MAAMMLRNPRIQISRTITLTRYLSSTATQDKPNPPPSPTIRQIKTSIRNESDPDKLVETFTKTTDHPRSLRDRSLYTSSVQKLKKMKRLDLVEKILEQQKQLQDPTEGFWIRIMMLYSNVGMLDHAIRTFHEMKCEKTVKSFCALLTVCLENKKYDLVHEFAAKKSVGIEPNVVVHNLVMRAFIGEGKIDRARDLLGKMDVKPDVSSYNVLLTGYLRNGDRKTFDEVFEEMRSEGFEPNLVTYNLKISMLCRSKECVKAKELLGEMKAKGVKPNEASFNAIIDGFCKVGDYESAKSVFKSMRLDADESDGVSPNADSYRSLIPYVVKEGEFEYALELCRESITRNWVPPFASMEGLVKGLVDLSKVDEAKKIVELMKKRLTGSATHRWTEVEALLPLQ